MTKTALYRHFNADGELLYVGISLSAAKRLSEHMREQLWAYEICRVEIEWFDGRDEAMAAEVAAIKGEAPKYNVVHKCQCKPEPGVAVINLEYVSGIFDYIGRDRFMEEVGVKASAVRMAEKAGRAPALWYDAMERLAGRPLDRKLFTFK